MRSNFPGFYKAPLQDVETLMRDAIIVLDTNVLLDIYRYSTETAAQIIALMEGIKEHLWMPYQVAYEYHKNRNAEVLAGHIGTYNSMLKSAKELLSSFDDERKHPFLPQKDLVTLKKELQKVVKTLEKGRKNCAGLIINDAYKERIADLYEGRLGVDYNKGTKEQYIKEAEERYLKLTPPGYEDRKKPDNKYGDYLIWRQMIDYASQNKCPVIFVSNDLKEDWIEEVCGMKVGPRAELIDEFYGLTGQFFYCYSLTQFVEISNKYYNISQKVNKTAEKEMEKLIQEVHSEDKENFGSTSIVSSPVEQNTGQTRPDSQEDASV